MCSFLIFNWIINNIDYINYYLKFRGPDCTNTINYENFLFLHNLLHLTGDITYQPFINNNNKIVALFNGEIYNYKDFGDYKSDGYCLIDLYLKYGFDFIKHLDGEFAITLFDFKKNIFVISTDIFSTKPLWYAIDKNKLGISSYESALNRAEMNNIKKLNANTTLIYQISTLKLLKENRVHKFNFKQFKTTYDDWLNAFINSIKKRTNDNNYDTFICLSSGYDSGSICCILNQLKKNYESFTIIGSENHQIINDRVKINNKKSNIIKINDKEKQTIKKYLDKNAENFEYTHVQRNIKDDPASIGMAHICKINSAKKNRICLTGTGADEIHCDYGHNGEKKARSSCFGGKFPEDLNTIVSNNPKEKVIWESFYNKSQKDFLSKEEIIGGLYGIECRYPFLDKYVVQEFLNLTSELKNQYYKGCIEYLLKKYNYPYEKDKKRGFNL
jgi:asparagine synthetase B (glutamine-hydrolysing)